MATFSQLKTEIANKWGEPDKASLIGDQLNSVIRYFSRNRFWFNEESTSITLTIGDPVIPNIPSDFLYEIPDGGLIIDYSDQRYRLEKVGNAEYASRNSGDTGIPEIYRNRDSQLEVYFYPDQAYTLLLFYVKGYTDLSADGDTNGFTDNAERLIVNQTLAELFEHYNRDMEKGGYFRSIANLEFQNLMRESAGRTSTGSLDINELTTYM